MLSVKNELCEIFLEKHFVKPKLFRGVIKVGKIYIDLLLLLWYKFIRFTKGE